MVQNPQIYVSIDSIKPYSDHARKHSKAKIRNLAKSMSSTKIFVPILIDEDGVILAGHARVEAAKFLGIKIVPAIRVSDLTELQKKAFIIADNKLVEMAVWNYEMLAKEFNTLIELNFDVTLTCFSVSEIDVIIGDQTGSEEKDSPLPTPLAGPAVSRTGDIWQLGKHRVLCGNSLEGTSYQALMANELAQCVLTDPPYNVRIDKHVSGLGKRKHREFSMACGEMSRDEFIQFLSSFIRHVIAFTHDGSIHFIFMDWRHLIELLQAGQDYTELKNICVWVKDNAGMGSFYRSQHELVFVYKNGNARHINNFGLGEHRYRTNVWQYAGANSFKGRKESDQDPLSMHPTVKPVPLLSEAIMDCSDRNGIVLDPFLGSGSTLIAAEKTGRRCYGIEIDPLYVDVIIRRWESMTGQQAINVNTGKTFTETMEITDVE